MNGRSGSFPDAEYTPAERLVLGVQRTLSSLLGLAVCTLLRQRVRPDFEAMDRVADIHREVHREHALTAGKIEDTDRGGRGTGCHQALVDDTEPAAEALSREFRIVDAGELDLRPVVFRERKAAFLPVAGHVAQEIGCGVIEQHAVAEQTRVMCARRQFDLFDETHLCAEPDDAARAQAGQGEA